MTTCILEVHVFAFYLNLDIASISVIYNDDQVNLLLPPVYHKVKRLYQLYLSGRLLGLK